MRRESAGSAFLIVVLALLIVRPWEKGEAVQSVAPVRAPVTRVVDGDTFEARIGAEVEDIRMIGVDTPETVKPGTPIQCYGPQASHFMHRLLEGRRVLIVPGVEQRDIYGRLLAYVHLGDRFVNATLVRRGLARTLTIPPNDRYAPFLRRLEFRSARAGTGLWGACGP